MRCLIWVCIVYLHPIKRMLGLYGLNSQTPKTPLNNYPKINKNTNTLCALEEPQIFYAKVLHEVLDFVHNYRREIYMFNSAYWEVLHAFFKINFFENFFKETPSECQTVWIQIRADILMGLFWVQTVCKGVSANRQHL